MPKEEAAVSDQWDPLFSEFGSVRLKTVQMPILDNSHSLHAPTCSQITLKIRNVDHGVIKPIVFQLSTSVSDACRLIREKIPEINARCDVNNFGLYKANENEESGIWLDNSLSLQHYMLNDWDILDYKNKLGNINVFLPNGSTKKIVVDLTKKVCALIPFICESFGITNWDEYAIAHSFFSDEGKKSDKREEQRKSFISEKRIWLDGSKDMYDYYSKNITEFFLLRRFFYSDRNVGPSDCVQLAVLYAQCRDDVLNSVHQMSLQQAIELAGLQLQVELGDCKENKANLQNPKKILPKEHAKVKGVEKKVLQEYMKHTGLSESEAQYHYLKLCRNLPSYGYNFFLVKEKVKGKNKLILRLLGVNKDSIVRVDRKTKQVIQSWPLTHVKRWGASPNTFTLDFGDYAETYYSVQTTEGDEIGQIISGYINITLRKRRSRQESEMDSTEQSTLTEEVVSPAKATIVHQSLPFDHVIPSATLIRDARHSIQRIESSRAGAQQEINPAYRNGHDYVMQGTRDSSFSYTFKNARATIFDVRKSLERRTSTPRKLSKEKLEVQRQHAFSRLSAVTSATAQIVSMIGKEGESGKCLVASAISAISNNLTDFAGDVQILSGSGTSEDGEKLILATKKLCTAFSDLVTFIEDENNESRQSIFATAGRIGEACFDAMNEIEPADDSEIKFQEGLLSRAKSIAAAVATLVVNAKEIAAQSKNSSVSNEIISSATRCALSTSQLVSCTKVVTSTLSASQSCKEFLSQSARYVADCTNSLFETAQDEAQIQGQIYELRKHTRVVLDSIENLKSGIANGQCFSSMYSDEPLERIIITTDKLCGSIDDPNEVMVHAKGVAQATAELVISLRKQAEQTDDIAKQRSLLNAARSLAHATSELVECARRCASLNDPASREQLLAVTERFRIATKKAAGWILRRKMIRSLQRIAKEAVAMSIQVISATQHCEQSLSCPNSYASLMKQCRCVAEQIPRLVHDMKTCLLDLDCIRPQVQLLVSCEEFLIPATKLSNFAKMIVPTVSDSVAAMRLSYSAKQLFAILLDLRASLDHMEEVFGTLEISAVADAVKALEEELIDGDRSSSDDFSDSLVDEIIHRFTVSCRNVDSSISRLLNFTDDKPAYIGSSAKDAMNALVELTKCVRLLITCKELEQSIRTTLLEQTKIVLEKASFILAELDMAVNDNDRVVKEVSDIAHLRQVSAAISEIFEECIGLLPGQRDVIEAIRRIDSYAERISFEHIPPSNKPSFEIQAEMNNAADIFNKAAHDVLTGVRGGPKSLAISSHRFASAFKNFLNTCLDFSSSLKSSDQNQLRKLISLLQKVHESSVSFLIVVKSFSYNSRFSTKTSADLIRPSRVVTDKINEVISFCLASTPNHKTCDYALGRLKCAKESLFRNLGPLNNMTYYEAHDCVVEHSKALGEAVTRIVSAARANQNVSNCVQGVSDAAIGLVDGATQAAYLVGVNDESSIKGEPSLVDQVKFLKSKEAIEAACGVFQNEQLTSEEILSAAATIAKFSSFICSAAREASSRTSNSRSSKHFLQYAKEVADQTSKLVKIIKNISQNHKHFTNTNCDEIVASLLKATSDLCNYAVSKEFSVIPAAISTEGKEAQKPIISAICCVIDGTTSLINSIKSLTTTTQDPLIWQQLSSSTKMISDAIKRLITEIKEKAPGQMVCRSSLMKIQEILDSTHNVLSPSMKLSPNKMEHFSVQFTLEKVIYSALQLLDLINQTRDVAKFRAERLDYTISQLTMYIDALVRHSVTFACNTPTRNEKYLIVDQVKRLLESAKCFVAMAMESGGNFKNTRCHSTLNELGDNFHEAAEDLLNLIQDVASDYGIVSAMIDSISKTLVKVDEEPISHAVCMGLKENILEKGKQMLDSLADIATCARNSPQILCQRAGIFTQLFHEIADSSRTVIASFSSVEVANKARLSIQNLGRACISLIRKLSIVQNNPGDSTAKEELNEEISQLRDRISFLLTTVATAGHNASAEDAPSDKINSIIADLHCSSLSSSPSFNKQHSQEAFPQHREIILDVAKNLINDTKNFVSDAVSNQDTLSSHNVVKTISKLAEAVKTGAASLGSCDKESQVLLISAVKDVAIALNQLIDVSKPGSGICLSEADVLVLKDAAKVMVNKVSHLLKTVKSLDNDVTHCLKALENIITHINQEVELLKTHMNVPSADYNYNPTNSLTQTVYELSLNILASVEAWNSASYNKIKSTVYSSQRLISEIVGYLRAYLAMSISNTTRSKIMDKVLKFILTIKEFYEKMLSALKDPGSNVNLTLIKLCDDITNYATQFSNYITEFRDLSPLTTSSTAENELNSAASSIEGAANKLKVMKLRQPNENYNEKLHFDEQVLQACQSIVSAEGALIKAATSAQKEICELYETDSNLDNGECDGSSTDNHADGDRNHGQWSQGLISAAHYVAAACHSLCDSANALIQGAGSEEKLISSARQVAANTAALLVACKVKSDPKSEAMIRLQNAGNAVKRATECLVRAAQVASEKKNGEEDDSAPLEVNSRLVGGMAQEILAKEMILRKERELQEARSRLKAIRLARYGRIENNHCDKSNKSHV